MSIPFKMKGWSPFKQSWESTMTSLTDIRSEHRSTLTGFRESGLSLDHPDVRSVISKLKQIDVDIATHESKFDPTSGKKLKKVILLKPIKETLDEDIPRYNPLKKY